MTGWTLPPVLPVHVQAAMLRAAFPGYTVTVLPWWGQKPCFELVSRNGSNPYALISTDATEIWRTLRSG